MRHGEVGAGDEEPAAVSHQRRLLDLGSDHHPRRVAEHEDWDVEGVAELHEARGLVGPVAVNSASEVMRVVGDHANRLALEPDMNEVTMPSPKCWRISSTESTSAIVSITSRTL